ncbi:hypothetical protein MMC20_000494 [Loxospora ochrophaea]|nr:hypothetical protein [Loxospora ochrophaea]
MRIEARRAREASDQAPEEEEEEITSPFAYPGNQQENLALKLLLVTMSPSASGGGGAQANNDDGTVLKAQSMQVQAQSVHELFGAASYTTLDGGLGGCVDCSDLALRSIPSRTQSFKVDVGLQDIPANTRLYYGLLSL